MEFANAKQLTASGKISDPAALFMGITVYGGSAQTTATVYDNSAGSGTIIEAVVVPANQTVCIDYAIPVYARNGLYVTLAGTGGTATVRWARQ
jgi:hypothetical protein